MALRWNYEAAAVISVHHQMSLFLIIVKLRSFQSFSVQNEGKPQCFRRLHLPITRFSQIVVHSMQHANNYKICSIWRIVQSSLWKKYSDGLLLPGKFLVCNWPVSLILSRIIQSPTPAGDGFSSRLTGLFLL